MSLSFLLPKRTVLHLTDDFLGIYSIGPKGGKLIEAVPWETDRFAESVSRIIAKDAGGKPIIILHDMVEQHYRKEKVLQSGVGIFDKKSILKRKLNMAFPSYPIRAALPLKEKPPKGEGRSKNALYIFTAVPDTENLSLTIEASRKSLANIKGLVSLPVEAASMVKTLAEKLSSGREEKPVWAVFMGQHRNGGLRQVITKNGELALTRMSPVIGSDNDAELWARDVFKEYKATISYLTRFGYQPEDGLELIALAPEASGEALNAMAQQEPVRFTTLTLPEAGKLLGLPIGKNESTHYADVLHVLWAGTKTRFTLPLRSPAIEDISRPRQVASLGVLLFLIGIGYFGYQSYGKFDAINMLQDDLQNWNQRKVQLQASYNRELERREALGFDVELVQSAVELHERLEREKVDTLPFVHDVGRALGENMRLDNMDITASPGREHKFTSLLNLTYPSSTDVDAGNAELDQLKTRLETRLQGHSVEITQPLERYEYEDELVLNTQAPRQEPENPDYKVSLQIQGPPAEEGGR